MLCFAALAVQNRRMDALDTRETGDFADACKSFEELRAAQDEKLGELAESMQGNDESCTLLWKSMVELKTQLDELKKEQQKQQDERKQAERQGELYMQGISNILGYGGRMSTGNEQQR